MSEPMAKLWAHLPSYLGGHMLLSLAALGVGLAVSLPLGIIASRRPKFAEITLGIAGVIQTVPSLALLALMVPLLGRIGFLPAFIALTLYSVLPILANTIVGIRGVDPLLIEAARGLGMSEWQMLRRVQLPLAAPVIIGGIRTATVLVVGTATLVTPVGGTCLGNYIFVGLNTRNHVATVFGCVFAALLAIVLDQLVRLLELAAQRRSKPLAWTGGIGLMLVFAGGLYAPLLHLIKGGRTEAVVGSLEFTEQHILSEVLAKRLRAAGFVVDQRQGLGEGIQFDALARNEIDCCVEYSGNIWAKIMKRTDFVDRTTANREIADFLADRYGVVCAGTLGFENAYALAVGEATAARYGLRTIEDLRRYAADWEVAGDTQIFDRPEWREVTGRYGLKFAKEIAIDPTLLYDAVSHGRLQVICAYTSDGRIRARNLRLLADPKQAFPPYDALLLFSARGARKPGLVEAVRPFLDAIDLETMQKANLRVDVEAWAPERAADELLATLNDQRSGKLPKP